MISIWTNKPFANNLFENVFVRHIISLSGAQAVVLAMLIQFFFFFFSISSQSQGSAVTVTDRIHKGSRGTHFSVATFFLHFNTFNGSSWMQQRDVTHSPLNTAWHRAGWLSLSLVPQTSSGIWLWLCLSGVEVVIWWLSRAIRADLCTPSYIQKQPFLFF